LAARSPTWPTNGDLVLPETGCKLPASRRARNWPIWRAGSLCQVLAGEHFFAPRPAGRHRKAADSLLARQGALLALLSCRGRARQPATVAAAFSPQKLRRRLSSEL